MPGNKIPISAHSGAAQPAPTLASEISSPSEPAEPASHVINDVHLNHPAPSLLPQGLILRLNELGQIAEVLQPDANMEEPSMLGKHGPALSHSGAAQPAAPSTHEFPSPGRTAFVHSRSSGDVNPVCPASMPCPQRSIFRMNPEGQIQERLHEWVRIPLQQGLKDGHSFLMLEQNTSSEGHLFYRWLHDRDLQLVFTSQRWHQTIRLERTDVICVCKQDYPWPYCLICQKFHWHGAHRVSHPHTTNLAKIQGMDDHEVRRWVSRRKMRFPVWSLQSWPPVSWPPVGS